MIPLLFEVNITVLTLEAKLKKNSAIKLNVLYLLVIINRLQCRWKSYLNVLYLIMCSLTSIHVEILCNVYKLFYVNIPISSRFRLTKCCQRKCGDFSSTFISRIYFKLLEIAIPQNYAKSNLDEF